MLVNYSSSDKDEQNEQKLVKVFKAPEDDFNIQNQHQIGSFPTFVYLNIDISYELQRIMKKLTKRNVNVKLKNEIHITLAESFQITLPYINQFLQDIQQSMKYFNAFHIDFDNQFTVFENREKSYITLLVQQGKQRIVEIIQELKKISLKYTQTINQNEIKPHITLGIQSRLNSGYLSYNYLSEINVELKNILECSKIYVMIGQRINEIRLIDCERVK